MNYLLVLIPSVTLFELLVSQFYMVEVNISLRFTALEGSQKIWKFQHMEYILCWDQKF